MRTRSIRPTRAPVRKLWIHRRTKLKTMIRKMLPTSRPIPPSSHTHHTSGNLSSVMSWFPQGCGAARWRHPSPGDYSVAMIPAAKILRVLDQGAQSLTAWRGMRGADLIRSPGYTSAQAEGGPLQVTPAWPVDWADDDLRART